MGAYTQQLFRRGKLGGWGGALRENCDELRKERWTKKHEEPRKRDSRVYVEACFIYIYIYQLRFPRRSVVLRTPVVALRPRKYACGNFRQANRT